MEWSKETTKISIITSKDGEIWHKTYYKCYEYGFFSCRSGADIDLRFKIESRKHNKEYIFNHVEGYPKEFLKTNKDNFTSFWDTDDEKEKKARRLLIKAKQIERFPTDNNLSTERGLGYLIVANRMYQLLTQEFNDSEAILRHLESREAKDFLRTFNKTMSEVKDLLSRIENNTKRTSKYTQDMISISKKGFSDAKSDRAMSAYYADKHRKWEKYMHLKDKGYQ